MSPHESSWLQRIGPIVAALALTGATACAADSDTGGGPSPSASGSASTSRPTPPDSPASATTRSATSATSAPNEPSATPSGSTADHTKTLLRAGATAEKAVSGSTLTSIEAEQNGWQVEVVTPNGAEHEMTVSDNGDTVVSGPTEDYEEAADRAQHRKRLKDSAVDHRQAVEAVSAVVSDARVSELDLDTWKGRTVWEADVIDGSGAKRELKVDANTAKVVANRADR